MSVVEINKDKMKLTQDSTVYTEKEFVNEYDAYIGLNLIQKLYDEQLITDAEKQELSYLIMEQFTPYYLSLV